jgi:integrase
MQSEIKVHVIDYGRKNLYMRFVDPLTNKQVMKSTGTNKRRDAERVAAKWEHDLREGRYQSPSKITWEEFWEQFDRDYLSGLSVGSQKNSLCVCSLAEQFQKPSRISDVNNDWTTGFQTWLRERGLSEETILGYCSYLRSALQWAYDRKMITEIPKFIRPKRRGALLSKGRPITTEEFERMLSAVPKVIRQPEHVEHWKHYLTGLWWSGLRLTESQNLYWDRDDRLCIDLSHKRPMFWIPGQLEKGGKDRYLPMAPEFAEFILRTPEEDRHGKVFTLNKRRMGDGPLCGSEVGRTASKIGKAANIAVHTHPKTGKVKFASAHDLRRSFGFRWSSKVMPAVLKELMRHERIDTTMKYYVCRNADATADVIWDAYEAGQEVQQATTEISRFVSQ